MVELIEQIKKDHPELKVKPGQAHCWSPEKKQISYGDPSGRHFLEGLLHELGHARLKHRNFASDVDLLQKEVEAWQEARRLAERYKVKIDENHIQECLDTYREWLYRRSRCPECESAGVQKSPQNYRCINCNNSWRVGSSRSSRPYRLRAKPNKKLEEPSDSSS